MQFLENLSALLHLNFPSSIALFFGIIYQKFQKDLSKNEVPKHFKKEPAPSKRVDDPHTKKGKGGGCCKDGAGSSFATNVELQ